ncbi:probable receptor-like protein kinase At5g20050 [Punica granatum]|uniref:Probable receptor-like protein kinase At5g20050 n=1 Tax=Punica granatum TaxID=22663 RepID=A0A218WGR1_PUNGR|nr:probable receptor-like protein kinase At5g20050 [Punica granatum]OWM71723.1 hypothetical protein CDL15_Pgr005911 [Punica granatum]
MESKKVNLIAALSIFSLVILIVVTRVTLKLSKTFYFVLGADVSVIVAIFAFLLIRRRYNLRRKLLESRWISEGKELKIEYSFLRKVAGVPTKFRYREIEEATDNFQALVGRGASASVFKGILTDGTQVAVKRIDGQERGEKEFRSEVSAIAGVQHVNLVRLLGYCCVTGGPRFLVYDFIPNGSLDCWIFPKKNRRNRPGGCLSWDLRYKIAIDIARALSYLHHDCRSRVLHLDVKPENILLDENYRGIVADFGLSRLMGKDESRIVTTIRGTRGYLAPEWLLEHGVTEKSDIYSYGMVLLEMIGGTRNVCLIEIGNNRSRRRWQYFPKIVCEKLREGRLMEVVDHRLLRSGGIDEQEVRRMVYVALWCIQERARLRPSMQRVVEMLEGRAAIEEPPETQMIVVDLLAVDEEQEQEINGDGNGRTRPVIIEQVGDQNPPTTSAYSFTMSVLSPR